ncbi:methionyl-tRNA formyltransferase [Sporomusa acidovorans]|uniref:Methionyl-tRNA formyltransferase n=1 Tax=Sporomusa acidovorans (strain ATCC 49682 / DSM 3132 / Mol) TaxID=1123286 RepID=A0ABZ3J2X4_SPOA4|nr:methionyl-tRNA formyltransferase [Sporomusa acidovorans]OZC20224.1 methionyl-tRNA formyltransferase [Sporomusa acidovorans DSM 3132]SDD41421.1 methionyl-tRNA formyltransferase [Sporomusa acidovorans]
MKKLKTIFMGTPDFAVPCLDMLVKEGYYIAAVVTQPDRPRGRGQKLAFSPVKEAALHYNLSIIQPENVKNDDFYHQIAALAPDVIVVVAFGQLLPKKLLELPTHGCINVHASLLPKYRGSAPIHWAIINGETLSGITTMYMDIGMDTGDMILKGEVPILPADTTGSLHDKLRNLGAGVLSETLQRIAAGTAPRTPQNDAEATYARMLCRTTERIDWHQSATAIHNLVRGLNPWPVAYCKYQNKSLKIWQTRIYNESELCSRPGQIAQITRNGLVVETGKGTIELLEVQPESKRRMKASDCVCGYCLREGMMLE